MTKKTPQRHHRLLFFVLGMLTGMSVMFFVLQYHGRQMFTSNPSPIPNPYRPTPVAAVDTETTATVLPAEKNEASISKNEPTAASNDSKNVAFEEPIEQVAEDKLLFTTRISLERKEKNPLDSLLIHDNTISPSTLRVEFWQTPMNSIGYQRFPDRIALFGFYDSTLVRIVQHDRSFLLLYRQDTYHLTHNNRYIPLHIKR